jgi:hypothetical protein
MSNFFTGSGVRLGGVREVTNSSPVVAADAGGLITVNSTAASISLIVPADADAAWLAKTVISCYQTSTAVPSFTAANGVTIHNPFAVKSTQYAITSIMRVGSNEWAYVNNPLSYVQVSAALDFASINAQTSADLTIAAPGSLVFTEGKCTALGLPSNIPAGLVYNSFVTAGGATVTIRATNVSAAPIDASAGIFTVNVGM